MAGDKDKDLIEWVKKADKDLFERWKYFEERADKLKERLWITGTWLATILGAGLALPFTAKFIQVAEGAKPPAVRFPIPLLCVAIFGLLFGCYALAVLKDLTHHIERNFIRANFIQTGEYKKTDKDKCRRTAQNMGRAVLHIIVALQLLAFGILSILAILKYMYDWRR